jgi:flagellar basal body-associated protein FliL
VSLHHRLEFRLHEQALNVAYAPGMRVVTLVMVVVVVVVLMVVVVMAGMVVMVVMANAIGWQ